MTLGLSSPHAYSHDSTIYDKSYALILLSDSSDNHTPLLHWNIIPDRIRTCDLSTTFELRDCFLMIKNLATQVSSGLNLNQVGFSLIFTSPNPQVLGNSQLQEYYTKKCTYLSMWYKYIYGR